MHWPVEADAIRKKLPNGLTLDTFQGESWIGIVPFHMSGIRLRGLPPFPYVSAFAELNVRTYVHVNGRPGVYFFSLDAANWLMVHLARRFYSLPYFWADMSVRLEGNRVHYESVRQSKDRMPRLRCCYEPNSPPYRAEPGTLEHWLTERYGLYTTRGKQLYWGAIQHEPWPLQAAQAEIVENRMLEGLGVTADVENVPPLLHFAKKLDVWVRPLQPVTLRDPE